MAGAGTPRRQEPEGSGGPFSSRNAEYAAAKERIVAGQEAAANHEISEETRQLKQKGRARVMRAGAVVGVAGVLLGSFAAVHAKEMWDNRNNAMCTTASAVEVQHDWWFDDNNEVEVAFKELDSTSPDEIAVRNTHDDRSVDLRIWEQGDTSLQDTAVVTLAPEAGATLAALGAQDDVIGVQALGDDSNSPVIIAEETDQQSQPKAYREWLDEVKHSGPKKTCNAPTW